MKYSLNALNLIRISPISDTNGQKFMIVVIGIVTIATYCRKKVTKLSLNTTFGN